MKVKADESSTNSVSAVMKYIEIIMAIAYIIVGALVLLRFVALFHASNKYALPLGSMLIAYGFFRTYRVYLKYFKK